MLIPHPCARVGNLMPLFSLLVRIFHQSADSTVLYLCHQRPKRVMKALIEHLQDISKMSVASWLATSLDFVVFTLFNRGVDLPISSAAALGSLAGAMLHFTICRLWVFRHSKQHGLAESLGRYIIVSGGALILHSFATTLLANSIIPLEELAWLISKNLVFLFWVYPGTKYMVFGPGNSFKPNPPNLTSNPKQR